MTAAAARAFGAAAALVLAAACERGDLPADPVWGKQACAYCRMVIGEPRTAAEIVSVDGTRLFFDDPGCMIAYVHERGAAPRHAWVHDATGWVHDATGPSWLDAERAVYTGGEQTPMDFGFVAHAGGSGFPFDDFRARVLGRLADAGGGHGVP